MSTEGFGCLYIPSLAPQSTTSLEITCSNSPGSQENTVLGGIGIGERIFPPQLGLTFSTWICIEKFSDPRRDPHPVRLLTIARNDKSTREISNVCLSIVLSTRDKAIIVSVQEYSIENTNDWQPEYNNEWGTRVWFPDIMKEGEWHHLIFSLNRYGAKGSCMTLFVNGLEVASNKMNYISQPSATTGSGSSISVNGWIGTPPAWRKRSNLCWKQGPCLFLEEAINSSLAKTLYRVGPHYLGTLQAPQLPFSREIFSSQILEEKVLFGLNAIAITELTLSKIRKVFTKFDSKSLAKQLGMTSHENATPIRVVHNSAGHLFGPARPLGGIVVGYLGVRTFSPKPVSKSIQTVGNRIFFRWLLIQFYASRPNMQNVFLGKNICFRKTYLYQKKIFFSDKDYFVSEENIFFRKKYLSVYSFRLQI